MHAGARGPWGHDGPPRRLTGTSVRSAARLPWPSTLLLGAIVMIGSSVAARGQLGERAPLDLFARALLFIAVAVLLVRHRHPVLAVCVCAPRP